MTQLFRHADGGTYRVLSEGPNVKLKERGGEWEPAVIYRAVDPTPGGGFMDLRHDEFLATTTKRWAKRFTAISQ